MAKLTDEQLGEILANSIEDDTADKNQYSGSYHRGGDYSDLFGDCLLIGEDGDKMYNVPLSIKKLRENFAAAGIEL